MSEPEPYEVLPSDRIVTYQAYVYGADRIIFRFDGKTLFTIKPRHMKRVAEALRKAIDEALDIADDQQITNAL